VIKWFITLLFVFVSLPVVAIKAALPQTYIHLDYEVIYDGYYDIGDGIFVNSPAWVRSNQIQIPRQVDKLYFSGWHTHFVLFYNNCAGNDYETYIGFYYNDERVFDLTWSAGTGEKILGTYNDAVDTIHMFDVPTNATHILLQTCGNVTYADLQAYMENMPTAFTEEVKPLIYYPAPADTASNITFGLMPVLMIVVVIAGLTGSLIMMMKKSKG